jgi:hypothetical protein
MKDYKEEFDKFLRMLSECEHFGFSRFSDGEIFILKNKELILEENRFVTGERSGPGRYTKEEEKSYDPKIHSHVSLRLKECLSANKKNYFKGLSCNEDTAICLEDDVLKYQMSFTTDDEHLTFSNLFINANYPRFIQECMPILRRRRIVFVANEKADLSKLGLNIIKDFRIGSNCFINNYDLPSEINEWIESNDVKDVVFLISASTLTNFIVKDCFFKHPDNTYIDIGSSLNPWMGLEGWQYSRAYLQHWILGHHNKYGIQEDTWS